MSGATSTANLAFRPWINLKKFMEEPVNAVAPDQIRYHCTAGGCCLRNGKTQWPFGWFDCSIAAGDSVNTGLAVPWTPADRENWQPCLVYLLVRVADFTDVSGVSPSVTEIWLLAGPVALRCIDDGAFCSASLCAAAVRYSAVVTRRPQPANDNDC